MAASRSSSPVSSRARRMASASRAAVRSQAPRLLGVGPVDERADPGVRRGDAVAYRIVGGKTRS